MVYIKHIRITPIRRENGLLYWRFSYYINRRGKWGEVVSVDYHNTKSMFEGLEKMIQLSKAIIVRN